MSDKNIALWNEYQGTSGEFVKDFPKGKQTRKSVAPQYKKKQITKAFGPMGIGWGVVVGSERYERRSYGDTHLLDYFATAWFVHDGQRGEIPIASTIKEAYMTRGNNPYLLIDDEAVKKVRTDALTKGFTDLGFCADIHMGLYDDVVYVQQLNETLQAQEYIGEKEAMKSATKSIQDWLNERFKESEKATSPQSKVKYLESIKKNLTVKCQAAGGVQQASFLNQINEKINNINTGK